MHSALKSILLESGAAIGAYRGVDTALAFTSPADELGVARDGCALYDMSWRAKCAVTGEDRTRWLNGMLSNNVRDLPLEYGVHNFVLDAKGRILGDLDAYNCGEYLMLSGDLDQLPRLLEHLDTLIVMDNVELTDIGSKLASLGLRGAGVRALLDKLGLPQLDCGQICKAHADEMGFSIVRGCEPASDAYEFWVAADNAALLWSILREAGATPVGATAIDQERILRGEPLYGRELDASTLPQESGQLHALHFAKGCYVGQETVERIRSRGGVHRALTGFIVEGAAPEVGSPILFGDKEVGRSGSSTTIIWQGAEKTLALAIVRREASAPGAEVTIGGQRAVATTLPFEL